MFLVCAASATVNQTYLHVLLASARQSLPACGDSSLQSARTSCIYHSIGCLFATPPSHVLLCPSLTSLTRLATVFMDGASFTDDPTVTRFFYLKYATSYAITSSMVLILHDYSMFLFS